MRLIVNTLLALFLAIVAQAQNFKKGTYDGMIGRDAIILVIEDSTQNEIKGFYILNRENPVEDQHSFLIRNNEDMTSDLYSGKLKLINEANTWSGKITLTGQKRRFLFFKPKANIQLQLRTPQVITTTKRYQREMYNKIEVKTDIIYGKALGYWTRTPYEEQPYIEVVAKGISNYFTDMQMLPLMMDIYLPQSDTLQQRPLFLFIHGGAFYIGNRQSPTEKEIGMYFAKRGYVVASIDYRLGFMFTATDVERSGYRAIQDAHAALRYLSSKAKEYHIDPTQVYVGGTSAGAIASLNVAFMDNDERPLSSKSSKKYDDLGNIESSGNTLKNRFEIKAVANMWGAVNDVNIIDTDEKISVISIHGTADDIVPYDYDYPFQNTYQINRMIMDKMYGSKAIHDRLNQLKVRNQLISLQGKGHEPHMDGFTKFNQYMDTIKTEVSQFLYQETAPSLIVPQRQLSISKKNKLKPFYYEINNGHLALLKIEGGVKISPNPNENTIIWYSKTDKRQVTLYTTNQYGAWTTQSYNIHIENE